ncbi:hypothetical protein ABW21_db0202263 [Orbilia brochopaga]|nr:hypothetical protein ABW21_db0202263 [Drechslerella brochopaga]
MFRSRRSRQQAQAPYYGPQGNFGFAQGQYYNPQGQYYNPQGQYYDPQGQYYQQGQYFPQGQQYQQYQQGQYYNPQGQYYNQQGQYYNQQGQYYDPQGQYYDPQGQYYAQGGSRSSRRRQQANQFNGPWNPMNAQNFNQYYHNYRTQQGVPVGADGGFFFQPDMGQYQYYDPNNPFAGFDGGEFGDLPGFGLGGTGFRPQTYSGRCRFNSGNRRGCPERIINPYSQFCDFHTFASGAGSVPFGNEYNNYAQWAYSDPRSAAYAAAMNDAENYERWRSQQGGGNFFPGFSGFHGATDNQAAWISMREIDHDNWPCFLKCAFCGRVYNEPVTFTHPDTGHQVACCRGCTSIARQNSGPMPSLPNLNRLFRRTPKMQWATQLTQLRAVFEKNFLDMVLTHAPHQICYFCRRVMTDPVVTCKNVPPQFWVHTHGTRQRQHPDRPVHHAFCKSCLEQYRFSGGADYAQCPFTDKMWAAGDNFPLSIEYNREARGIAGRAWELTLQMAQMA